MNKLTYKTLKKLNTGDYFLEEAPERVLQFGEGNFLRGFADYFFDLANETCGFNGKIVMCQPIETGLSKTIHQQNGLYTLYLLGRRENIPVREKRLVSAVSRCINPYEDYRALLDTAKNPALRYILSNTTEAGIVFQDGCAFDDTPPASFPAKLTRFLWERYLHFGSERGKGFIILPCELIDDNGKELLACVLKYCEYWNLSDDFRQWVQTENLFCSTLVDRIVTGYPTADAGELNAQNGYEDALLVTGESFGLWVIEGPERLAEELPFSRAGLPVMVVRNHHPYRERKVRILNGAHTVMMPVAFLFGKDIVRDCMADPSIRRFLKETLYREIIPTLRLPKEDLIDFAESVMERFWNPFIDHALLSISLNSVSKWRARVLPSLKAYQKQYRTLPKHIVLGLAALLEFYHGAQTKAGYCGKRAGQEYPIRDLPEVLAFFAQQREKSAADYAANVLGNTDLWGEDLNRLPALTPAVSACLKKIREQGMFAVLQEITAVRP